jgi:hypothetical protein
MRMLPPVRSKTIAAPSIVIALLALAWPASVLADCVDTRPPTAAEKDFHSRAMAAIVAALPPVPVGGKLQNKDSMPTLGQQCAGTTGDFVLEASRYYELNYRKSIVTIAINATRPPSTSAAMKEAYGPLSPKRSAGLKVINVTWSVSGSDSPLRQSLADAIDRTQLQSLVGKPLPSVVESQARAAQASPVTVADTAAAAAAPAADSPTSAQAETAGPSAPATSGQPTAADPVKDTVDTFNKLRGLFGR